MPLTRPAGARPDGDASFQQQGVRAESFLHVSTDEVFGDLPFDQVLQHAADIGYDCVEVMCWPPGVRDRKYGGVTHIDCT